MTIEWALGVIAVLLTAMLAWIKVDTKTAVKLCHENKCDVAEVKGIQREHGAILARHDRIIYDHLVNGTGEHDITKLTGR